MRFLFYSHDGVGLGHVRRNLALAGAVTRGFPTAQVLVATSVDEVCQLGLPPNVETLKIPGLRKVSKCTYGSRRLAMPSSDIHALRSALLLGAVRAFHPDVLVVDKHPLGAGSELRPVLEAVRSAGGRTVFGLRDVLDARGEVRREWHEQKLAERIAEYYDLMLVYGCQEVFDPVREYDFPDAVAERTYYCGYVLNWPDNPECLSESVQSCGLENRHPFVLGTTGGGEDGYEIIKSFVQASEAEAWTSMAITGPLLPAPQYRSLERLATQGHVTMHNFVPGLSNLFRTADALVCMGGYNTLTEAVACGIPTVCIPRTQPRVEQLIRARSFERLGLLRTLRAENLSAVALRREVKAALKVPRQELLQRAHAALHFDGAERAADHLVALAASNRSQAANESSAAIVQSA